MRKNVKKVLKKGKKGVIKCMNIKSIEKKWNILRKIIRKLLKCRLNINRIIRNNIIKILEYIKKYYKNYKNILRIIRIY